MRGETITRCVTTYVVLCIQKAKSIIHEGYINFAQWRSFSSLAATGPWIAGMFHTRRVYLLYSSSFCSDLRLIDFHKSSTIFPFILATCLLLIEGTLPRFQAAWGWLWAWQAGMTSVFPLHSILLVELGFSWGVMLPQQLWEVSNVFSLDYLSLTGQVKNISCIWIANCPPWSAKQWHTNEKICELIHFSVGECRRAFDSELRM